MMSFSEKILLWYAQNKRTLPWRGTRDPYRIWLSEVILQQTRVAQGTPYYERFLEKFPTVNDLAQASEEEVLKLWQGLGYYSRARNLHKTAKMVANGHNGRFPSSYDQLLKLKGIGDYTASAIASICFDEPRPVVDGNVYRVLARYFGVELPINTTKGVKYFKQLAWEVMNAPQIREYNQGLMEFGAIQCTPQKPYCLHCPLNEGCVALNTNKVKALPVKLRKTKVRKRHFNYLVPMDVHGNTKLYQRKGKGIWQNLYEFPLLESNTEQDLEEIQNALGEVFLEGESGTARAFNNEPIVHKLSHQHLHTKFWIVNLKSTLEGGITFVEIEDFPVPVLIADFIKAFKNSYF